MKKRFKILIAFLLVTTFLSAQQEIKVMSYNIRLDVKSDGENQWDKRKDRVAGLMNFYEADFIGAQEVLQHQLTYLLQHLSGYDFIGVGRDDGKQAGEYSNIFYKKEKYTLVQQNTFWLSPTPDSISKGWDAAIKRVCTYGLFRDKKTKQFIWVFNTHFDHIGKTARLESAKLITKRIQELNKANYPVVLMGDFNSRPEEPPAEHIMSVMQNARAISNLVYGDADTWNGFKFQEKPNGCIDYIFIPHNKKMQVLKFATLTDSYDMKYPSDHFAVLATIQVEAYPFIEEISAFKKTDSVSFPPKNAILFTGSSSVRMWKGIQSDFPTYDIINRGFGGSTLTDLVFYEKDIIFPYHPRQIVIYSGENDLAASDTVTARMVFERFRELFEDTRDRFPEIHVAFISIKPSPSRIHLKEKVVEANELIRSYLKKEKKTAFIDVYHAMLRPDGSPRAELFLQDKLHMNREGYLIWQKLIEPHLLKK
jgi:endonuclease/exonuclease/phosphatase family metal-dependent hydrolase/lysophospholipase L1-like esterase